MSKIPIISAPIIFTPQFSIDETTANNERILRVRGKCQEANAVNENGRVYPDELWEKVVNNEKVKKMLKERVMVGELDHPTDRVNTELKNVSHLVTNLWKKGESVYLEAEILKTIPSGKILAELIKSGVKVGVSSRGVGTIIQENGKEVVNPDDYELITFDFVSNPSVSDAYPKIVESKDLSNNFLKEDSMSTKQVFKEYEKLAMEILNTPTKKVPSNVKNIVADQILEMEGNLLELQDKDKGLRTSVKALVERLEKYRTNLIYEEEGKEEKDKKEPEKSEDDEEFSECDKKLTEEDEEGGEEKEKKEPEEGEEKKELLTDEEGEEEEEKKQKENEITPEEKPLSEMSRKELIRLVKIQKRVIKEADRMLSRLSTSNLNEDIDDGVNKDTLYDIIEELVKRIKRVISEGKVKLSDFLFEEDEEDTEESEPETTEEDEFSEAHRVVAKSKPNPVKRRRKRKVRVGRIGEEDDIEAEIPNEESDDDEREKKLEAIRRRIRSRRRENFGKKRFTEEDEEEVKKPVEPEVDDEETEEEVLSEGIKYVYNRNRLANNDENKLALEVAKKFGI